MRRESCHLLPLPEEPEPEAPEPFGLLQSCRRQRNQRNRFKFDAGRDLAAIEAGAVASCVLSPTLAEPPCGICPQSYCFAWFVCAVGKAKFVGTDYEFFVALWSAAESAMYAIGNAKLYRNLSGACGKVAVNFVGTMDEVSNAVG